MTDDHKCSPPVDRPRQLSCGTCGRFTPEGRDALRTIGFTPFTGGASINKRVAAFLDSGEPELLKHRAKVDGMGLGV